MIWGRELEYIMPRAMYENLRDEAPKGIDPKKWIMNYINDTFGLLGTVTEIRVEG